MPMVSTPVPIPVSGNGLIARSTKWEDHIREADRVRVAQVETAVTVDADGHGAISVPVTDDRIIPADAVIDLDVGKATDVGIL